MEEDTKGKEERGDKGIRGPPSWARRLPSAAKGDGRPSSSSIKYVCFKFINKR